VCSYIVEQGDVMAHGKGVSDWIKLTRANVYYDHPVSVPLDHALIIDFVDESAGPGSRVSVELSADSARELIRLIQATLETGQAAHDLAAAAHA
jgi:hypothetical protein